MTITASVAHVLIVEDDDAWRRTTRELVEKLGCSVTTVSTGEDALVAITEAEFQLVLLDLGLPTMTGMATLRELRARAPRLPLIVLTAFADAVIGDAVLRRGATAMVAKEHAAKDLPAAVARALGMPTSPSQSALPR